MVSTASILDIISLVSYLEERNDRNMPGGSGDKGKEDTVIPMSGLGSL
jgi:hypothetical protein